MNFRRTLSACAALAALLVVPLAAHAGETASIGVNSGTSGFLGFNVGVPIGKNLDGRLQFGTVNIATSVSSNDNTYDGNLKVRSLATFIDFHPMGGAFMLTSGLYNPGLDLTGTAMPSGGFYTINNNPYTAAEVGTLSSELKWNSLSPYFGFGFGPIHRRHGLGVGLDLGAAFTASPTVTLTAGGPGAQTDPALKRDLAAEQQQLDDVKKFNIYPVLNLSLELTL